MGADQAESRLRARHSLSFQGASPIACRQTEPNVDAEPIRLVLDTNIVLDWLVFEEPALAALHDLVLEQRVIVLSNAQATDELARVLAYRELRLPALRRSDVIRRYESYVTAAAMPEGFAMDRLLLPVGFPRCRDRDDDVFTALAYHGRAAGLVTRDKALLKLKRRAARFGVPILEKSELFERVGG
jgi:putative PIN family toxin of toxin-antitoxin system